MNENIEFYKSLVEEILDEFVTGDSFDMERDASQFRNTEQYNKWFSKFIAEDEKTDFTDNQLCESTVSEASEDDLASFELFLEEIMEGCITQAKKLKTFEGEEDDVEEGVEEGDSEVDAEEIKDKAKKEPDDGCKVNNKASCKESFIEEMIEDYLNEKCGLRRAKNPRKVLRRRTAMTLAKHMQLARKRKRDVTGRNKRKKWYRRVRNTGRYKMLAARRSSGHLLGFQKRNKKYNDLSRKLRKWFHKRALKRPINSSEDFGFNYYCISICPSDIDYTCYLCDKLGIDGDYYEDANELYVCGEYEQLQHLIDSLHLGGSVEDYGCCCDDDDCECNDYSNEMEININITTQDELEDVLEFAEEYDLGVDELDDESYAIYGDENDMCEFMQHFGLIDDDDCEYCVAIPDSVEGVEEYAEENELKCESEEDCFVVSGTPEELDECCAYFNINEEKEEDEEELEEDDDEEEEDEKELKEEDEEEKEEKEELEEDVDEYNTNYTMSESEKSNMFETANDRKEAILEHIEAKLSTSQFFSSLNESDSQEVKSVVTESVKSLLEDSCKRITEDLINESERYVNEEVIPSILKTFDEEYVVEIVKNLNEQVDAYLQEAAQEVVESLEGKKLIVKSQKSAQLESFEEELMNLIESKLQIIPEREDALLKATEKIDELTDKLQEASLDQRKFNRKIMESKREAYVYKNMPSNISESQKEKLLSYVNNVLVEANDMDEFSSYYDDAVKELMEMEEKNISSMKLDEHKNQPKEFNDNFSDLFSNVMKLGQ